MPKPAAEANAASKIRRALEPASPAHDHVRNAEGREPPQTEKKADGPFASLDSLEAEMARLLGRNKLT